jgi:hypothetical protein
MKTPILLAAAAALIVGHAAQAASLESTSATTTYHRMTVDGVGVFYREAGPKDAPTLVLLHGLCPLPDANWFRSRDTANSTQAHTLAQTAVRAAKSHARPKSGGLHSLSEAGA